MNIIIEDNKYYKNIKSVWVRLGLCNLDPSPTQIEFGLKKFNPSSTSNIENVCLNPSKC